MTYPERQMYFLRQIGGHGPIKIGCSRRPDQRLRDYCKWSPVPLEILATVEGTVAVEVRLHTLFCNERLHHEWFEPSAALLAAIEEIKVGKFDFSALPRAKARKRDAAA